MQKRNVNYDAAEKIKREEGVNSLSTDDSTNTDVDPLAIKVAESTIPYYAVFVFRTNYENWDLSEGSGVETIFLHQDYKSRWRILDWITEFNSEE